MTSFQKTGAILQSHPLNNPRNVDNVDKNLSNNVETSNVNVTGKNEEEKIKYIAQDIAEKLDDLKNLNFYLKCAREHNQDFLYKCLSITQLAEREGKIKTTPAKYFVGVFKIRSKNK